MCRRWPCTPTSAACPDCGRPCGKKDSPVSPSGWQPSASLAIRYVTWPTLGVAYVDNALANPNLYRVMFDSTIALVDEAEAAASFEPLVAATRRAQQAGRFDPGHDPGDVATQYWATGHGITSLTVTGVLTLSELHKHAPAAAIAVFIAAGDTPPRATASVRRAWQTSTRPR